MINKTYNINQIKDKLHIEEIIEMLKKFVEFESPTRDRQLTNKMCDFLQEIFNPIAKVTRISHGNKEQQVGDDLKIEFGNGDKQVLIITHMDTVWEKGEINERPFTIEDNKIYGPGIFDMKYGIVQTYYAMKALLDNNINLGYKVVLYICSHEEIGSRLSREFLEQEAKKSECIFVLEPSAQGGLKIQRKGVSVYNVVVKGKSAHAGGAHEYGISAIKEIAHIILQIESLTNYEKGITVNVGYLLGGREVNMIPDHAELKFEVRYWTNEQCEEIYNKLKEIKPKIEGSSVDISLYRKTDPMEKTQENIKLFEFAKKVGEKMDLDLFEMAVGGISDGNRVAHLGIPILDGLGAVGSGAHAKDEHILKDKIAERIALLTSILIELSKTNLKI